MRYFVTVTNGQTTTYIYEGKSHEKAAEARQMIVNVLRSTFGSGVVMYKDAQSMGSFAISGGKDQRN